MTSGCAGLPRTQRRGVHIPRLGTRERPRVRDVACCWLCPKSNITRSPAVSPVFRNRTFTSPLPLRIFISPAHAHSDKLAPSSRKIGNRLPNLTADTSMRTSHPSVFVILLCLVLAVTYYKFIPSLSSTTDYIVSSIESGLQSSLSSPSSCTKEIGEGVCCDLHLGAEPCLDECRKTFVDRQTFQLTKEYEECADQCLIMYHATCAKGSVLEEKKQLWNGEVDNEAPAPNSRRRRQAQA
jgi:hypothetical protein